MNNSTTVLEGKNADEIYSEGELFLNASDGLELVKFCEQKSWVILGIEGGTFDGTSFTPDLSLIRDYSAVTSLRWDEYRKDCNSKARAFIAAFSGEDTLRFYLTFVDEHDFSQLRSET